MPAMRSPIRSWLAGAGLLLLALTTGFGAAPAAPAPATRLARLKAALAQADRVTITPQVATGKAPTAVSLTTAGVVDEFLDNLEIDEAYGPVRYESQPDAAGVAQSD